MQLKPQSAKKSSLFSKRLAIWTTFFVMVVAVIFTYSETAHAGLVSYLSGVFGSQQVSAEVTHKQFQLSSQNIALLQYSSNLDPNPEKSATSPVNGSVLNADVALSESAVGPDVASAQISSYTVRDGDTLSEIAQMFGVSVNTLVWANDISRTSSLRAGQVLIILPVTGISYTVKSGDTVKGVAQKYKADIDEILQYNDLSINSKLTVGQTIIIPDAEAQTAAPITTKALAQGGSVKSSSYYVRPCDLKQCLKTQGIHGHNGVDLADRFGKIGGTIFASAPGTVILSKMGGWNGGYGNYIIISHPNGTQSVYAHLSQTRVTTGQQVDRGQVIGSMGSSGNSTGPHIHFEIRGATNPF